MASLVSGSADTYLLAWLAQRTECSASSAPQVRMWSCGIPWSSFYREVPRASRTQAQRADVAVGVARGVRTAGLSCNNRIQYLEYATVSA